MSYDSDYERSEPDPDFSVKDYCARCNAKLTEEDFNEGGAQRREGRPYCFLCMQETTGKEDEAQPPAPSTLPLFSARPWYRRWEEWLPWGVALASLAVAAASLWKIQDLQNQRRQETAFRQELDGLNSTLNWYLERQREMEKKLQALQERPAPVPLPAATPADLETLRGELAALRAETEHLYRGLVGLSREIPDAVRREAESVRRDAIEQLPSMVDRALKDKDLLTGAALDRRLREAAESEARESMAFKAFLDVKTRHDALVKELRFVEAYAALDTFPEEYRETRYGAQVKEIRDWDRDRILTQIYPGEEAEARKLLRQGKLDAALLEYQRLMTRYGIPELAPAIREQIEQTRNLIEQTRRLPPPPAEAEIRGWTAELGVAATAGEAIEKLVRAGKPSLLPLIEKLSDAHPDGRRNAAIALGRLGDARAIKPLLVLGRDDDPWVRQAALVAVGKIGDLSAAPDLLKLLESPDETIAAGAHEALELISGIDQDPLPAEPAARKDAILIWKGWWLARQRDAK